MTDESHRTSRRAFLGASAAAAAMYGVGGSALAAKKPRGRYVEKNRVDVHGHSLVPAYREALAAAGITAFHRIPIPAWSPELALEFMEQHDIALQFLSVSDPGVSFIEDDFEANALARKVNDQVAAIVKERPRRFGSFGVVNLRDVPNAVKQAKYKACRAVHTLKTGRDERECKKRGVPEHVSCCEMHERGDANRADDL